MRLRATRRGRFFLGLMVMLYLAAVTSQSSLLLLVVGIVLGCLLVNLTAGWQALKGLRLEVPRSVLLAEGQPMLLPWKVRNCGKGPAAWLEAQSSLGRLFRLPFLGAGQEAKVAPELRLKQRGVFPYAQVRLACAYPFGLLETSRRFELAGEVVVAPAVYEVDPPQAAGFDLMVGGKHKGKHWSTSGADFSGVRPMQPGDPLKQIHWRSSAKGNGLMVKTFDEELSGRVAFVVDSGHSGQPQVLDDCLRAAGSLMFAALEVGHHIEWIDLAQLQARLVPPLSDGEGILDALARLALTPDCLARPRLERALASVSHRSALHLVLTACPETVGQVLGQPELRRRKVTLYLPQACPAPGIEGATILHYSTDAVEA